MANQAGEQNDFNARLKKALHETGIFARLTAVEIESAETTGRSHATALDVQEQARGRTMADIVRAPPLADIPAVKAKLKHANHSSFTMEDGCNGIMATLRVCSSKVSLNSLHSMRGTVPNTLITSAKTMPLFFKAMLYYSKYVSWTFLPMAISLI